MRFNHVGVSVSNLEQSIAFYRDLFGLSVMAEPFPFGGEQFSQIMDLPDVSGRMCVIGNGSVQLELFEFGNPSPETQPADRPVSDRGYTHFGFEVDDIAETYDRLKQAGVRIHSPVITFMGGSMKAIYARDPDGNVFEVLEPGKGR